MQTERGLVIVAVYVDDGLIAAKCKEIVIKVLHQLQTEFEITVCAEVGQFLGFQIEQLDSGRIKVHQSAYAEKTLAMFGMSDCHPAKVPIDKASLSLLNQETESDKTHPFASAVGKLMYLVVVTRPDLAYAVGKAAQWMSAPTVGSWKLIKHILRYLRGTTDLGIIYSGCSDGYVTVFSDSDYAGDIETRRSTSGYVTSLGDGAITWSSRRQECVALSTTEAEYIAASMAAKELIWLTNLTREFKPEVQGRMLVDNQGAIRLANNPEQHKRTKHIDVRFHYIRDLVMEGEISLEYVHTKEQLADMLTKPLGSVRLKELCEKLRLCAPEEKD